MVNTANHSTGPRRAWTLLVLGLLALLGVLGWLWIDDITESEFEPETTRLEAKTEDPRREPRRGDTARDGNAQALESPDSRGARPLAVLTLVAPDGSIVPHARLDFFSSQGPRFSARTDVEGQSTLKPHEGWVEILALAPGWVPQRLTGLVLTAGEHVLQLKSGREFEGILIHEDGTPAVGVEPGLSLTGSMAKALSAGLLRTQ